jgi:DNA-binding MarR family transcriptional regulator
MPRPTSFYRADRWCRDDNVGYLLHRVLQSVTVETDKRLEPHGLTHAQWKPLFMLRKGGSTIVAELARDLQVDASAMTRMLDRLEAKGLCTRVRCSDDRRVVNVALTPEGERAADLVPVALAEVLNLHLVGFSKAEWRTLKSLLHRMLGNAEGCRSARCSAQDEAEFVVPR